VYNYLEIFLNPESMQHFTNLRKRFPDIALGLIVGLTFNALTAIAWSGPPASAPGSNTVAPISVSTISQIKNGDLGVNNFSAFGNELLSCLGVGIGRYLNFDYTTNGTSGAGANGYGIRDNAGTLEFKNLGGSWASLQTIVTGYIPPPPPTYSCAHTATFFFCANGVMEGSYGQCGDFGNQAYSANVTVCLP